MTRPVPYPVSTPYGVPGDWAAGYHTGNDYACPNGTQVVATAEGDIVFAGNAGDYGNRVEIRTGDREHSYSHLSSIAQWSGHVRAGQVIGLSGSTGRSTGPHLHYEERVSPFSYSDDVPPVLDSDGAPATPAEEDEDMFVFFQYKNGIWLGDGMRRRPMKSEKDLADTRGVITGAGKSYTDWPGGNVANPDAFGVEMPE